jgi:uncharacterized membrane protein YdcZ (DUF606 family)
MQSAGADQRASTGVLTTLTGLGTYNSASFYDTARVGGYSLASIISVLTGTAPSIVVKLQHSPDNPDTVNDASANWFDVTGATFGAQTATGAAVLLTATGPTFARKRWVITRSGTSVTALSIECVLE